MSKIKRIGLDTSKSVFTLHCVDEDGKAVLRTNLRRTQMATFFKNLAPAEIALEACGSSHHWARELTALGHEVHLIPPQYVKPFVKRAKNDRNDAEAICEAAGRPGMRFVPVKTATQQAQGMVLKVRETLVKQRTQLVNALRGHAAEFGIIAAKGVSQITPLLEAIEAGTAMPPDAKDMLALLGQEIEHLDARLNGDGGEVDRRAQGQCTQSAFGHDSRRRSDHRANARDRSRSDGIRIRSSSGRLDRINAKGTFDRREATHGRYQPRRQ
jgi:transposase